MHFLFPLLKNSKSGVDDRGHRLRSGSPVTNLPGASPPAIVLLDRRFSIFLFQQYQIGRIVHLRGRNVFKSTE